MTKADARNPSEVAPAAFVSYTHDDDRRDSGRIGHLYSHLQREVSLHMGTEFEVFFDRSSIEWGVRWKAAIQSGIQAASLFIPILTPGYLRSDACRDELAQFIEHERDLGRTDLILPILYVPVPVLSDAQAVGRDSLTQQLSSHQYVDWTDKRFEDFDSGPYRRGIHDLATRISLIARTFEPAGKLVEVDADRALQSTPVDRGTVTGGAPLANPAQTFDSFVESPSNRFAYAAARAVAESPGNSYNPLLIYSDRGLGKTHLLRAIEADLDATRPELHVMYTTATEFFDAYIEALVGRTHDAFRSKYREPDVLLVDDIHTLDGRTESQEEFFHLFNELHESGRQLVLASALPPDAIASLDPSLRSRFKMGLTADIQAPDLETRLAMLHRMSVVYGADIPGPLLQHIAERAPRNLSLMSDVLTRLASLRGSSDPPLALEAVEDVLNEILGPKLPPPISTEVVLRVVGREYGFTVAELCGKSRQPKLVTARQVAMYLARDLTDLSYPAVAREFGGRDHTTVIHAVEKVKHAQASDGRLSSRIDSLAQEIRESTASPEADGSTQHPQTLVEDGGSSEGE